MDTFELLLVIPLKSTVTAATLMKTVIYFLNKIRFQVHTMMKEINAGSNLSFIVLYLDIQIEEALHFKNKNHNFH